MAVAGLHWVRLDLHVHTWASKCFDRQGLDEAALARRIIERCQEVGLAAIAVTDHNSGAAVDQMQEAARGSGVVVLPGVELSVAVGADGYVHVIAILPESASGRHVNDLLASLSLVGDRGAAGSYIDSTPAKVLEAINRAGGLGVFPHPGTKSGVSGGTGGQPRADWLQSHFLAGCEYDEKLRKHYTSLAMYKASDGGARYSDGRHNIAGIGEDCSWFKVDQVTFEALRQCFADHETRICIGGEAPTGAGTRIERVEVSGGFLSGLALDLHPGINSILGGKGTGKSLLIECIRFAFGCPPPKYEGAPDIVVDHENKLRACLGAGHVVSVVVRTTGRRLKLTRTYSGTRDWADHPTKAVDVASGASVGPAELRELCPVRFFSQREIAAIVEDGKAQCRLVDDLAAIDVGGSDATALSCQLEENDSSLATALRASARLIPLAQEMRAKRERLGALRASGESPAAAAMGLARSRRAVIRDVGAAQRRLRLVLREAREAVERVASPSPGRADVAGHEHVSSAVALARGTQANLLDLLSAAEELVDAAVQQATELDGLYAPEFDRATDAYSQELRQLGVDEANAETEKQEVEADLERLRRETADDQQTAERLGDLMEERTRLLDAHGRQIQQRAAERRERYAALSADTGHRLRVEPRAGKDGGVFVAALRGLKSGLREATLYSVAAAVTPRSLIDGLIADGLGFAIDAPGLSSDSAQKLVNALWDNPERWQERLAWQYSLVPEDEVGIQYRSTDTGEYKPLEALSVGGRSAALTTLVLCRAEGPVVIDQPEDSLDIRSVWEDIVKPLRAQKEERQFIITTHNSTLAVASDSDAFTLMEADAEHASVSDQGAIERDDVRREVIIHVEGGGEPYRLKRTKYGSALPVNRGG